MKSSDGSLNTLGCRRYFLILLKVEKGVDWLYN